jgi:pyruvate dehydrogenase E1 component beta subunit
MAITPCRLASRRCSAKADITIVTYSKMLEVSMKAADQLSKAGIEVEIVDLRTLRPLDMEPVLESFKKTNRAVIVEEGWKSYGVGAEIMSARIYEEAFDYVDAPIKRVAQEEVPLPYNRTSSRWLCRRWRILLRR